MDQVQYGLVTLGELGCVFRALDMYWLHVSLFEILKDSVIASLGVCKTGNRDNRLDSNQDRGHRGCKDCGKVGLC